VGVKLKVEAPLHEPLGLTFVNLPSVKIRGQFTPASTSRER